MADATESFDILCAQTQAMTISEPFAMVTDTDAIPLDEPNFDDDYTYYDKWDDSHLEWYSDDDPVNVNNKWTEVVREAVEEPQRAERE